MERSEAIRVLLVEDNPGDALLIREYLRDAPDARFALATETSLTPALARLATEQPDAVLLDLSLPDSHGFATFERTLAAAPRSAIVVMSGLDDRALAVRTVTAGAEDYLVKGQVSALLLPRTIRHAIERKRIRDALTDQKDLLRALIDSFPDHIYVKDPEGRFLLGNAAVASFFRLASPKALRGRTDFDFFPPDQAELFQAEEREILRTGQPVLNREGSHVEPSGEPRWVLTTKAPLRDSHGRVIGTVGINRDITDRRRAEQALRELNEDLARSQRELWQAHEALQRSHAELKATQLELFQAEKLESVGRLAAGVAHEVKNPLAILQMGIDYLTDSPVPDDPNRSSVLEEMRQAVLRADGIVRALVDFSANRELDLDPADVTGVLQQVLTLLRHELHRNHVTVETAFAPNLPTIPLDRPRITQVFVNLVQNAVQAMPRGGTLTLRADLRAGVRTETDPGDRSGAGILTPDQMIAVEVDDTGPGFTSETLHRLFEPFFTTKPAGQGTGLGLPVARRIVELHQGSLTVTNRAGGGVCALVMLPVTAG
jgi:PAS domain S-box-containing protein